MPLVHSRELSCTVVCHCLILTPPLGGAKVRIIFKLKLNSYNGYHYLDLFYYIRLIQPDLAFAQVVSWWCGIQHQQHQVKGRQACQTPLKRKEETTQMKQMKS